MILYCYPVFRINVERNPRKTKFEMFKLDIFISSLPIDWSGRI